MNTMNQTITLYTLSWNDYWEKFIKNWSTYINNLNTTPDEIIVVSDKPVDTSLLKHKNIKNIVVPIDNSFKVVGEYRNIAINNATSDWIVASDIDDIPLPNYLDDLDSNADICCFSFLDQQNNKINIPDQDSLRKRLLGISDFSMIPGTSAIKKYVYDQLRYEDNCYEDRVFYATASLINLKVINVNPDKPRFIYSGFHPEKNMDEIKRVSLIYSKSLQSNRNLYCFWFSKEMSDNRKRSLEIMKNECKVNLILIDQETFYKYENKEIPIHKGFKYLSDVHKSDYARAYMMYFYGEGYSDIKANEFDWNPYFDNLFKSKYDAAGVETRNFYDVGNFWQDNMYERNDVLNNYKNFIGMGHFIFKPKTELARLWLNLIHQKMDLKYEQLSNNPSMHPYSVKGGIHGGYKGVVDPDLINPNYPFEWAELGGISLHKAQHIKGIKDQLLTMPWFNMINYR